MRKARLHFFLATAAVLAAGPASATVVGYTPNVDLSSNNPYTVTFGDASYTFGYDPSGSYYSPITMGVGGTGLVYGNTPLEVGLPSALQEGTLVPDQLSLGEFFAPTGLQPISFSIAMDWVALEFTNGGQTFYGYAEVGGSYLDRIAYNDTPGGSITTGEAIAAAPNAAVPEPASWALMIGGFGLVGGALRRQRQALASA